jgi:hypothetical protein
VNDEQQHVWRNAEDRIWRAWYGALVAACAFLLLTVLVAGDQSVPRHNIWIAVADGLLTIALGWAMQHWKSRIAAGVLLLRTVFALVVWIRTGVWLSAVLSVAFATLYAYGLVGTIILHRLRRSNASMRSV